MTRKMTPKHRHLGIAMDEALLVTFMVGGLGTFGAVAVPWDSIMGTSAYNQAVDQLEKIETANAEYKKLYGYWPYEMTNGNSSHNVVVLMNRQALRYPYASMRDYKAVISDMTADITPDGLAVKNNLGSGRILQRPTPQGSNYKLEIILENVPLEAAEAIDERIDGKISPTTGRVTLARKGEYAHVVYKANKS